MTDLQSRWTGIFERTKTDSLGTCLSSLQDIVNRVEVLSPLTGDDL